MKYLEISRDYNPKVIGINDAGAQVETLYKNQTHSLSAEERLYLETFCKNKFYNKKEIYIDDFKKINLQDITLFKTRKKAKETDILECSIQNSFGLLGYAFSNKIIKILSKYNLPPHHKIKANIIDFEKEYYLMGFAKIPFSKINYKKSTFSQSFSEIVKIKNEEEYKKSSSSFRNIHLLKNYIYDVALLGKTLFFSEEIIKELKKENIIGYKIGQSVLYN